MVEEGLCCSASPKREGRNTQQTATCSLRDVSVHTAAPQFWLWHQHHISLYFWFYFFLPFWLFSIAYWSFLITCHANFLNEVVKGCKYYYFSVVWCIMWMEMALTLKCLHRRPAVENIYCSEMWLLNPLMLLYTLKTYVGVSQTVSGITSAARIH